MNNYPFLFFAIVNSFESHRGPESSIASIINEFSS